MSASHLAWICSPQQLQLVCRTCSSTSSAHPHLWYETLQSTSPASPSSAEGVRQEGQKNGWMEKGRKDEEGGRNTERYKWNEKEGSRENWLAVRNGREGQC